MSDEFEVGDLLDGEDLREGAVRQAVDRLAELREAKRRLEGEASRLQAAIAAHAKSTGAKEFEGSAFKLKVSLSETASLPTTGTPERDALAEAVRRTGLWERVSNLSAAKIKKAVTDDAFPEDDREALERLLVVKTSSRLTLSKLKK